MRNSSRNNGKVKALRGIMKNENLFKTLDKALNSPLGSTDRIRAKKMLSIIQKTSMDGKGGPGVSIPRENVQLKPRSHNYSRLVIFPAVPKQRYKFGEKPPVHDGQGGTGILGGSLYESPYGAASTANGLLIPKTFQSTQAPQQAPGLMSAQNNRVSPLWGGSLRGGLSSAWDRLQSNEAADRSKLTTRGSVNTALPGARTNTEVPNLLDTRRTNLRQESDQWFLNQPKQNAQQQAGSPAGQAPGQAPGAPQGGTQYSSPIGPQQFSNLSNPGLSNPGLGGGDTQDENQGLSSRFKSVQDAVKNNMGPGMFAYQALNRGGDYLKGIPGFEDLPEDMLSGGSLTDRMTHMEKALRQTYQLDNLLNSYTDLAQKGIGLTDRMTDYVRGRDEFLNETDTMLENLKAQSATMDMSDPRNRTAVNDHMNYLYEMRGRQNKRYVEFLTTSIDQYNSKLGSMETMYNKALDGYQRELEFKSNLTMNEYTMMHDALTGMYESVQQAPFLQAELETLQAQAYGAALESLGDPLKPKDYDTNVEAWEFLKDRGAITDEGIWNPNMAHSFSATNNPAYFLGSMMDAVVNTFNYKDKDDNPVGSDYMKQTAESALGWINTLEEGGMLDPEDAETYRNTIFDKYVSGMTGANYLKMPEGTEVKQIVRWLGDNPNATEDSLKKKFGDASPEVLDVLYSDFVQEKDSFDRGSWFSRKVPRYLQNRDGKEIADEEAQNLMYRRIKESLRAPSYQIAGASQAAATQPREGNPAQRNNNPLNIKSSNYTIKYPGVIGQDPVPAQDGGHFLVFDSVESGVAAGQRLLKTDGYRDLTVDAALKRWSNNGHGGEIVPAIAQKKVASLTPSEMQQLINAMAHREGFFA